MLRADCDLTRFNAVVSRELMCFNGLALMDPSRAAPEVVKGISHLKLLIRTT